MRIKYTTNPAWVYEEPDWSSHPFSTVTVAALRANKRPVGFAPWPEEPKPKKRKKRQ